MALEDSTFERAVVSLENQYHIMSEWQKLLDLLLQGSKLSDVDTQIEVLLKALRLLRFLLSKKNKLMRYSCVFNS